MQLDKKALDRWITREPPEEPLEEIQEVNNKSGKKTVKKGTKCSYISCSNEAISYVFTNTFGLNLCEKHGG